LFIELPTYWPKSNHIIITPPPVKYFLFIELPWCWSDLLITSDCLTLITDYWLYNTIRQSLLQYQTRQKTNQDIICMLLSPLLFHIIWIFLIWREEENQQQQKDIKYVKANQKKRLLRNSNIPNMLAPYEPNIKILVSTSVT
jgi:hypothetical protein